MTGATVGGFTFILVPCFSATQEILGEVTIYTGCRLILFLTCLSTYIFSRLILFLTFLFYDMHRPRIVCSAALTRYCQVKITSEVQSHLPEWPGRGRQKWG